MIWRVNDVVYRDIDELLEQIITEDDFDDEDYVEESINEAYGSIDICGEEFMAYDILHNMNDSLLDEYRDGCAADWVERERDDAKYDLERLDPGEGAYINGYYVECEEGEEDDEDWEPEVYVDPCAVSEEDDTKIRDLFKDFQQL